MKQLTFYSTTELGATALILHGIVYGTSLASFLGALMVWIHATLYLMSLVWILFHWEEVRKAVPKANTFDKWYGHSTTLIMFVTVLYMDLYPLTAKVYCSIVVLLTIAFIANKHVTK